MFEGRIHPSAIDSYITTYQDSPVSGINYRERWHNFLLQKTGQTSGNFTALEILYLQSLGYSGTLADMINQMTNYNIDGLRNLVIAQNNNIIINPFFAARVGNDFTNWTETISASSTITADTSTVVESPGSVMLSIDSSNSSATISSVGTVPVAPSTKYRFITRVKSNVDGSQMQVQLGDGQATQNYLQDNGTWTTTADYREINVGTVWKLYTFNFTTAPGQTTLKVSDFKRSGITSQLSRSFWIDKVQVFAV